MMFIYMYMNHNTIHMYSGITSGRVLDGELLYTKILEVNTGLPNLLVTWWQTPRTKSRGIESWEVTVFLQKW